MCGLSGFAEFDKTARALYHNPACATINLVIFGTFWADFPPPTPKSPDRQ
jgi:hypothetical protein